MRAVRWPFATGPLGCSGWLNSSTASEQVEDQDDDGYHQQNVDKAAADVQAEAQNPEDEKDDDDCPKH
jgi:hypothetical protein